MTRTSLRLRGWSVLSIGLLLGGCGGDDGGGGTAGNALPTLAGSPPTSASPGSTYRFTPSATDYDGDVLTFGIEKKPAWATFNPATGELSGTPAASDVGTYRGIVVWVTDGKDRAQLPAFDLTVAGTAQLAGNQEPTMDGTPPRAIAAGMAYSYTPNATDPDDDELTFTIVNRPTWANFDAATGRLWGTPGAEHVGTTRGVAISVTDGVAKVTRTFDLTVQAVATGSATLSWAPPTSNVDGTPLTNLAGYKVYWGMGPGDYANSVTVKNPGLTAYVVSNLAAGNWYFVMTALNTVGGESPYSNEARFDVQ